MYLTKSSLHIVSSSIFGRSSTKLCNTLKNRSTSMVVHGAKAKTDTSLGSVIPSPLPIFATFVNPLFFSVRYSSFCRTTEAVKLPVCSRTTNSPCISSSCLTALVALYPDSWHTFIFCVRDDNNAINLRARTTLASSIGSAAFRAAFDSFTGIEIKNFFMAVKCFDTYSTDVIHVPQRVNTGNGNFFTPKFFHSSTRLGHFSNTFLTFFTTSFTSSYLAETAPPSNASIWA